MDRRSFEEAFDTDTISFRGVCDCGKEYYNGDGEWDSEDGELERLEEDPNAYDRMDGIGFVYFEGKHYVDCCECWIMRAGEIMLFIDSHSFAIAEYLTLEKRRKTRIAERMPEVK